MRQSPSNVSPAFPMAGNIRKIERRDCYRAFRHYTLSLSNLNERRRRCRLRDCFAFLAKAVQMKLDRLAHVALALRAGCPCRDAPRKVGRIRGESCFRWLNDD